MTKRVRKGEGTSPPKSGRKVRQDKPVWPGKDAPFDVDPADEGDFATPKRQLDEQEVKEQEERRS